MKFILLSVISCSLIIGSLAAPKAGGSGEFVTEDDIARKVINDQLRSFEKLTDNNSFVVSLLKSVDQECMLKKFKKNNLMSNVMSMNELTMESFNDEEVGVDSLLIFGNIGVSCFSKFDALLTFAFDNLFSYSILIDAFRDDEPFKGIFDDLVCYNHYAVKNHVLDPHKYTKLNYKLVNETEAECNETIDEVRIQIRQMLLFTIDIPTKHRECLENEIAAGIEKLFFKYFLLVPAGLTDEQKIEEKANFITDIRDGLWKLLMCNVKTEE